MFRVTKKSVRVGLIAVGVATMLLLSAAPGAVAHELWVNALGQQGELFRADIGYGHSFPDAGTIPADRTHIFRPLQLVTPDGKITLDQVGENYAYQRKVALKKGSYLVLGFYRPTFWSKGPEGWQQTDRIQRPDATYVEEAIMCAKTVCNIQGAATDDLITKPSGQRLEIVPQRNPTTVGAKDKLLVQVLCDGKPVKGAEVEAILAGSADKENPNFKGKTDDRGMLAIAPLQSGYWMLKTEYAYDHPDRKRADEVVLLATLTFRIDE